MNAWKILRVKRNKLLDQTDKTQLADFPADTKTRKKYKEYRDYLRNLPKMYSDENIENAKVKSFDEWLEWVSGGEY